LGAGKILRVAVVVALLLVAWAAPVRAVELPVVESRPKVVVRAERGLERLAARIADEAPRDLARIAADLEGLPGLDAVEVRLVKRVETIAAAAPAGRGAPPWAVGTAYPDEGVVVVAVRGRDGGLLDPERTFKHELAHMALDRALAGRVPRWLTEGFAYLHSSDVSLPRYATLMGAVIGGRVLPLWELEAAFPAREDEAHLAYAQSYDVVAYLARRGRWADDKDDGDRFAFRRFLGEIARGRSLDAAAQEAFGRRLADLEAEWLESLRSRYFLYPFALGGATLWALGALLLVIGWWRRRRQARRTLARWDAEEAAREREEPS
jgi:hypothetical protein